MSETLGTRRTCPACSAPFYDLMRRPITCPKCQHIYELPEQAKPPDSMPPPVQKAPMQEVTPHTDKKSLGDSGIETNNDLPATNDIENLADIEPDDDEVGFLSEEQKPSYDEGDEEGGIDDESGSLIDSVEEELIEEEIDEMLDEMSDEQDKRDVA